MITPFSAHGGNSPLLADRLRQGTVLVVDDYDSMRKVTINLLKQLGADRIVEAVNGSEALRILGRQPVTLVLSDWNMPVMSGLDLLVSIRTNPRLFTIPFLMITSESERQRVMMAIHAGVSDMLVKPFTAIRFTERVEKALAWKPRQDQALDPADIADKSGATLTIRGRKIVPPDRDMAPSTPELPVKRATRATRQTILVVDDTADNLLLLSSLFKTEYKVKIAHNGDKALRLCHSDTPPDLILLDIMMPGMDGFEVARSLRGHPSSEHIPIIFVTAMNTDEARLKGMELGAVDFVTKPIDPDALKIRVKNFMRYVELHNQLQADYDEMMAVAHLKEDVESITRHDMKAPLAGLIGLVQGLADAQNLTDEQRDALQMIEESALQTLNMVNLSNELYKIETGRFTPSPARISIAEIVRRIVAILRKTYAVRRLTVAVATPHGVPDSTLAATGDAMLCYSLFQNLLKNACEAAPDGGTVTATILPAGSTIETRIENPGTVPAEIRERFFEKFTTARKPGGTGLGTYSARLLAEAQGGKVNMETSDQANQTVLTVILPRAD